MPLSLKNQHILVCRQYGKSYHSALASNHPYPPGFSQDVVAGGPSHLCKQLVFCRQVRLVHQLHAELVRVVEETAAVVQDVCHQGDRWNHAPEAEPRINVDNVTSNPHQQLWQLPYTVMVQWTTLRDTRLYSIQALPMLQSCAWLSRLRAW